MAYTRKSSDDSQASFSAGSGSPMGLRDKGKSPWKTWPSSNSMFRSPFGESSSDENPDSQPAGELLEDPDFHGVGFNLMATPMDAVLRALSESKSGQSSPPVPANTPSDTQYPLEFLVLLGDYAGRMWKCLRGAAADLKLDLPDRVGDLRHDIRCEHNEDDPWTTDIKLCVKHLSDAGLEANFEMARLAIDIYAARNEACHSKVGDRSIAHDPRQLERAIAEDVTKLGDTLPDGLMEHREDLVKLMHFFRDSGAWLAEQSDREESHRQLIPTTTMPPPAETSDAFGGEAPGYTSPVKSRSVSPSKRTASGSLKLARDEPTTSTRPSDPVGEGLRAMRGIREDIAKLETKCGDTRAIEAIRNAKALLQEAWASIGEQAVIEEGSPRKRGRGC
ncbi:uncharacterized protein BJX67DRAFT_380838 [Aspergillus lucknowensis]|uniref:Uncharacterized protein n=1 Tax=Aspergillus lucknowensis TaxID=176173 RepID=A0ABR4LSG5_9EURO